MMIGPHWFVSFIGMGLLGGLGGFIYWQLQQYLSIYWKASFLGAYFYTIGSYIWIFCKKSVYV